MKIGILGGIGPFSSAYFYSELVRRIADKPEVKHNSQYPQIILNSIPTPQLENNATDNGSHPCLIQALVQGIKELALLKPEYIIMVCNTVHLFLEQIKIESGFTAILDLSDIVRTKLSSIVNQYEKICILGTPQTVEGGLYCFQEYNYLNPSKAELAQINEIVYGYSSTGDFKTYSNKLLKIIQKKQREGVSLFLLSCTEVSLLVKNEEIQFIDTLECLLEHVCEMIYQSVLTEIKVRELLIL